MEIFRKYKFYLASNSERRINILKKLDVNFDIVGNIYRENYNEDHPVENVLNNSKNKVDSVKNELNNGIVIGCDTVIYYDRKIIGKPVDRVDAFDILKTLNGSKHSVISGLTLYVTQSQRYIQDFEETDVYFNSLSETEIEEYLNTNEYKDKAGAYAIQGIGAILISKIEGCFYNVVGFPIVKFYNMLKKINEQENK